MIGSILKVEVLRHQEMNVSERDVTGRQSRTLPVSSNESLGRNIKSSHISDGKKSTVHTDYISIRAESCNCTRRQLEINDIIRTATFTY